MTAKVLLLDVVGLTDGALRRMPRLNRMARAGARAELGTVLPAVTCSVQSSVLTGAMPASHGIVGNGWYFRELGDVLLWRQHNRLVHGEKLWETARRRSDADSPARARSSNARMRSALAARIAVDSEVSRWSVLRPRRRSASSMHGRSSRTSEQAWMSSTAPARSRTRSAVASR